MTRLEALIRARIAANGPISVAEYMSWCLGHPEHGYYMTRDPFGGEGDFTTAPEISQMFGEIVGAWLVHCWLDQGSPRDFVLAELGPGRGTLMRDILRVGGTVPGFVEAARVWLVERSPVLREAQARALAGFAPRWADAVGDLPEGALWVVANEFFDALPVEQFQLVGELWRERVVAADADGDLAFDWARPAPRPDLSARFPHAADGAIVGISRAGEQVAGLLGGQIAGAGGAALIVDYGAPDGTGDTLQAVRGHAPCSPLHAPGEADLTAHVSFSPLAAAASPARAHGPAGQGAFLEALGITARAARLARANGGQAHEMIAAAHRRLTHPDEMGTLFKVLALTPDAAGQPAGFMP